MNARCPRCNPRVCPSKARACDEHRPRVFYFEGVPVEVEPSDTDVENARSMLRLMREEAEIRLNIRFAPDGSCEISEPGETQNAPAETGAKRS